MQLEDLRLHKSYDFCVKVLDLGEEVLVSSGLKKQDLVVADNTGSARFTIWQDEIGTMTKNNSYHVRYAVVREFRGQRFFSTSKKGTTIQKAEDLGDVIKGEVEMPGLKGVKSAKNVQVLLVSSFTSYHGCYKCRSKLEFEDGVGECTKCSAVQSEDAAKLCYMAVMTIDAKESGKQMELRAYDKVLGDIAAVPIDEITPKSLIKAAKFGITYQDGIIGSVCLETA